MSNTQKILIYVGMMGLVHSFNSAHASPRFGIELKPFEFIQPAYEGAKQYGIGGEFHLTGKVAIALTYREAKKNGEDISDDGNSDDLFSGGMQMKEQGVGLTLYSSPTATSLYVGMGMFQRVTSGSYSHLGMPVTWQSTTKDPYGQIGLRSQIANLPVYFRGGILARWTTTQDTSLKGGSRAYYFHETQRDDLMQAIAHMETREEIKYTFDLGIGVIF